ncbi:DUF433 domain-containing protein [Leptolyngbya sp. AN03gr2]|uniref:DUF433 domain-containing protein n=1 Tax=unclassified Leptolyngbya TaxID=2650499 RepID=UPI003D322D1F
MLLEDYFEFLSSIDIRLKGTRVGIEHILYPYLYLSEAPEAISEQFESVTLEQVYATILYYLHDPKTVGQYVTDWIEQTDRAAIEQDTNPSPQILRLRQIIEQQRSVEQVSQ